ncbi:hypothetical protein, partial [Rothia nasimurium]|uniref:hypothetical protein n=1 Tax=Rothia nasimurium TaxID=85336 RepID=UPI001F40164A
CAVLCRPVPSCAVLCRPVPSCAVLCRPVPSCAVLCRPVPSCASLPRSQPVNNGNLLLATAANHSQKSVIQKTPGHCFFSNGPEPYVALG